ncbi:spermatogenesis-associated protein 5-like [Centruroides sculpturatus]|uniref:spermatogenesis-associated protein 5-like n=1 Tax=Centruroides sculpturatus TaxID=218467 RepID=UPI000C6DA4B5|nr:spermatogenesis-associated protein 5-like [Centruroides sculpturatus]
MFSEAKLREIFSEAKIRAPSIIFIDEFDVLCPKYQDSYQQVERRVLATLLTLMDSLYILKKLLKDKRHSLTEENMKEIAEKLHGYTGADLNCLCRNVCFMLLKEQSDDLVMTLSHFNSAIREMKPSALKEMDIQISKVK